MANTEEHSSCRTDEIHSIPAFGAGPDACSSFPSWEVFFFFWGSASQPQILHPIPPKQSFHVNKQWALGEFCLSTSISMLDSSH